MTCRYSAHIRLGLHHEGLASINSEAIFKLARLTNDE